MREILFRGQTRKFGEKVRVGDGQKLPGHWVYGGVLQGVGAHSIIYGGENLDDPSDVFDKWPVYTDTLGQYTGLTDKNGKKIFEGDIIQIRFEGDAEPPNTPPVWYETGKVIWHEQLHGWYVVFDSPDGIPIQEYDDCDNVVVIGNIHDNPELLEG